jgi:hypothetical protein
MTPSSPALRVVSIASAAAVLALVVGLFPARPAAADSPEPPPATTPQAEAPAEDCGLLCLPILGGGAQPTEAENAAPTKQPAGPSQPVNPAPADPAGPEQPPVNPATVPATGTPVAGTSAEAALEEPPTVTSATGSAVPPSNDPTRTSSWDTPVTRSERASQVAAIEHAAGSGPGGPKLLPVAAGVLLVGAGAGAFIWWGRNRLRMH